jgi:chorismate synthase
VNTFGHAFRVTTFGESHGPGIGCVIDGCPPGILIAPSDFEHDLERRATGRTRHTSQRHEADQVEILSGVFEGRTTGTPITLLVRNTDAKSKDYGDIANSFRPGHADYTYQAKYGQRDYRGGGRSSARETTARVAAAVLAKRYLAGLGILVRAFLSQCGALKPAFELENINWTTVESTPLFWPDAAQLAELEAYLDGLRKSGDSVGGRVSVIATGVPPGLGEPLYGKLDGDLAAALMGINAVKAVEIGDGVAVCAQRGSEHRDEMRAELGEMSAGAQAEAHFLSNHAGGILGGISTGQALVAHVSIKPTSSILVPGLSVKLLEAAAGATLANTELVTKGRHDPCVAIRAPAIVEAMVALVLIDHLLRDRAQNFDLARVQRAPLSTKHG